MPVPIVIKNDRRRDDRIYRTIARGTALATFAILALIGFFLLYRGLPAWRRAGLAFFTTSGFQTGGSHPHFGVAASLYGTVIVSIIAVVFALPISLATALCITEYVPIRARRSLIAVVDLGAAIPSVIYGFWGLAILEQRVKGVSRWLTSWLSWIPLFKVNGPDLQGSLFIAGLLVAIMIVPIITSVAREVISLTPPGEREAALALGATRFVMIKSVVLPFSRGGIFGAVMLGLGRALGETIAVVLILGQAFKITPHLLESGGSTVASMIAVFVGSGGPLGTSALLFAGFTLFVVTVIVNLVASAIVARSRSGSGVEL